MALDGVLEEGLSLKLYLLLASVTSLCCYSSYLTFPASFPISSCSNEHLNATRTKSLVVGSFPLYLLSLYYFIWFYGFKFYLCTFQFQVDILRTDCSPELQTHLCNYLFDIFTWMSSVYFKINISHTEIFIFPLLCTNHDSSVFVISVNGTTIHPGIQAKA